MGRRAGGCNPPGPISLHLQVLVLFGRKKAPGGERKLPFSPILTSFFQNKIRAETETECPCAKSQLFDPSLILSECSFSAFCIVYFIYLSYTPNALNEEESNTQKTDNGASQEFFNEKNLSDSFSIVVKDGHCCHQRIAFSIRYKTSVCVSAWSACVCVLGFQESEREREREIKNSTLHFVFFSRPYFFFHFHSQPTTVLPPHFLSTRSKPNHCGREKGSFISFHFGRWNVSVEKKLAAYFFVWNSHAMWKKPPLPVLS